MGYEVIQIKIKLEIKRKEMKMEHQRLKKEGFKNLISLKDYKTKLSRRNYFKIYKKI